MPASSCTSLEVAPPVLYQFSQYWLRVVRLGAETPSLSYTAMGIRGCSAGCT